MEPVCRQGCDQFAPVRCERVRVQRYLPCSWRRGWWWILGSLIPGWLFECCIYVGWSIPGSPHDRGTWYILS